MVGAALCAALCVACDDANELSSGTCADGARFGEPSFGAQPDDEYRSLRRQCAFDQGSTSAQSLGTAVQSASPVEHVVVAMLENRSFDHLLSDLPAAGVVDADVASPDDANPTDTGTMQPRFVPDTYCIDDRIAHEWSAVHLQLNNGQMNGFVAATGPSAMAYYEKRDLPVLYGLAAEFAISDRFFSPLLGPTWPNRLFMFAGTSCRFAEGGDSNLSITTECGIPRSNIVKLLRAHDNSYRFYDQSGPAAVSLGLGVSGVPASFDAFLRDAAAGTLPQVSFVGASTGVLPPPLAPEENDDHPPANVQNGQQFLYDVVKAVTTSPAWATTVLFITYDEHGGFHDHVQPPRACEPVTGEGATDDYSFDQYGFRVPLVIVSPFARRHFVSHADADHTSITRFIEHWLGLEALTRRDANAWPLLDAFDFENPDQTTPDLGPRPNPTTCARLP